MQYIDGLGFDDCNTLMNTWVMDIAKLLDLAMVLPNGKRMTQAALAEKSGVSQPTISRILKGENSPDSDTLCKLRDALKKPAGYFLGLDVSGETTDAPYWWPPLSHKNKEKVAEYAELLLSAQKNPEDGTDHQVPTAEAKKKSKRSTKAPIHSPGRKAARG